MFNLYVIENLLIYFATYVHMHLVAPLATCVLPKQDQTQENNSKFSQNFVGMEHDKSTSLP